MSKIFSHHSKTNRNFSCQINNFSEISLRRNANQRKKINLGYNTVLLTWNATIYLLKVLKFPSHLSQSATIHQSNIQLANVSLQQNTFRNIRTYRHVIHLINHPRLWCLVKKKQSVPSNSDSISKALWLKLNILTSIRLVNSFPNHERI